MGILGKLKSKSDELANDAAEVEEKRRADISYIRGKLAAKIKDPEKRKAFIAKQGAGEEESLKAIGRVGGKDDDIEADTKNAENKIDSYKKGGKVRKTGMAFLHKGERVLNTKQTKKYGKKRAVKR